MMEKFKTTQYFQYRHEYEREQHIEKMEENGWKCIKQEYEEMSDCWHYSMPYVAVFEKQEHSRHLENPEF